MAATVDPLVDTIDDVDALLHTPLPDLMARAAAKRDAAHGARITFSPKVFIPLTMLCRDKCGYCTFAKPPAHVLAPYLELDDVLAIARRGAALGCHEALFTLGEAPEARYPEAAAWLAAHGYTSTVDYLAAAAGAVLTETGLLPHANAGALDQHELELLRAVAPSQGMMIETLAARLGEPGGPHAGAPDKTPARRLATLDAAGRAHVPFTTGILVGIGETRHERLDALLAIAAAQARHGHVQEVIVQNFLPKPGTSMWRAPACDPDEFLWTVAAARLVLDPSVHLQAPPNLSDPDALFALVDAGIDDWGGISPVTPDHVNPERPWPALDTLREITESAGHTLAPRLTVYPEFVRAGEDWLHDDVRFAVRVASDSEDLARDDDWAAGGDTAPPALLPATRAAGSTARASTPVAEVLDGVLAGEEVGIEEIVTLLGARGPEMAAVAEVADDLRRQTVGDAVTFVRNRNINYTNVCTFKCRFCAFSKGPLSLNLRGTPYLLDLEEIQHRVVEAVECGATEVCLQGGIHPDFDGNYYLSVARAVKEVAPQIHVHGFTALEVTEGARRLGMPLRDYLLLAKDAGLATLPGTAAEILDDEVRAIICPDKIDTEEWLDAHRTADGVGLRSNVTIMFGHVERPVHVARHLVRTRAVQKETGGFTEFVPLPFVHMATPLYLQQKARRGPTMREVLLMHAVGRIAYRGWIDNVQVSWVKTGISGARQALQAGCNDLGGTLMDENISRAAGASHGQELDESELRAIVEPLGRPLEQRTTLYGRTHTEGRRLRPPPETIAPVPVTFTPSRTGRDLRETMTERLDVVGIGNALVDVLSHEGHEFLATHHLTPGAMELIDTARAEQLYAAMGPAVEISGGSAANTLVGVASFGGSAAFIGRVADDELGAVFGHDIRAAGVEFRAKPATDGEPSGRCLIMVTPDAQRTMNTYLGASAQLGPGDVDHDLVGRAQVLYLEGYLWDKPDAKDAYRLAARLAHDAGNRVAFTLSDAFCVDRHRQEFLALIESEVDVLFANEAEILSLYEVDEFDDALQRVQHQCEIAALTRSERGAVLVARDEMHVVDATPVEQVVDTTGAGDQFAAGVLYGLTHGYDLGTAARLGTLAAAEVISHLGARPGTSLAALADRLLDR